MYMYTHGEHVTIVPQFDQRLQSHSGEVPEDLHCHDDANSLQALCVVTTQQVGQHNEVVPR